MNGLLGELSAAQWAIAVVGAVSIGLAKGGLPGLGNVAVALYALIFEARESVGIVLPVLVCADLVAIAVYRRHAQWRTVARLLPPTALGVVVGFFVYYYELLGDTGVRRTIGAILLTLTALHFMRVWLQRRGAGGLVAAVPHTWWFVGGTGVLGGLATMLANAAGPVAAFYLMAVGLPKWAFIGTAAWFFFIINVFKVPFQVAAGTITGETLGLSLVLGAVAAAAAGLAPFIVRHINQRIFSALVWGVVVLAGLQLLRG